ncbi:MAG: dihydrofolate reductase [Alphaproteobacteria bacterium]|nr:dihydrofolate reductase [Alphaproteobacteria bacterium]
MGWDRRVEGQDLRVEGYVIVSAEGMLADANRAMPDALRIDGDQRFFRAALNRCDLVVHGRHSHEEHVTSPPRRRIIVTRRTAVLAAHPQETDATLWNPAACSFEQACSFAGIHTGTVAIIGGPEVFAAFLDRYDVFWLSQAEHVHLAGGTGCFPDVPLRTPQQILAAHGMRPHAPQRLEQDVTVTPWRRSKVQ